MPDTSIFLTNLFMFAMFMRYLYYSVNTEKEREFIQCINYICSAIQYTVSNTAAISYNAYKFIEHLGNTRNILNDSDDEDVGDDETRQLDEKQEEQQQIKIVKYEDRYLDQYHAQEDIELSKDRLDNLKNSILMENTPQGNLIIFYDNSRESFIFYSDNTIPYRYLETVGRKYVIMNNCKRIFVDMAKEIDNVKQKLEQQKIEQQKLEQQKLEQQKLEQQKLEQQGLELEPIKKNVFAKLKSYNNPSKQQNPSTPVNTKQHTENNPKIVKEHANRYSYEGKLANFSFLKKVDRKVVDKKYAMSFADFKAMQTANSSKN
jgi:hypothetical protein